MSKQEKDSKVTKRQLVEMRKWREGFSQSVCQVTIRNKSTKDNPGTINCYFAKPSEPQRLDFDNLLSMAPDSDEENPVALSSSNLFCKDASSCSNQTRIPAISTTRSTFFGIKCKTGLVPFLETNFQDFSRTQVDFSRALKFTLTPTLPRSQC